MPRSLRIEYPGAIYHAMSRGNNGQETFLAPSGYRLFLATLDEVCLQTGWRIHAYVLMTNHYHLLLETPEANLVAGMKWFQGAYTQRFNAMFNRRGHLFQGRYKAIPVQTDPREGGLEYFRHVSSYIHLNPFRAKLCGVGMADPLESYQWSSYPSYCGLARKVPEWLAREKVLAAWGLEEGLVGTVEAYRLRMERKMSFEGDPDAGRRGEFEKQMKRGWFIGSEGFAGTLLGFQRGDAGSDNDRGSQRRMHGVMEAERLLAAGLAALEWREEDLLAGKSNLPEKQALAWLMKRQTTVTGQWIADRLRMGHRTNTSHALSRFGASEDERVVGLKRKIQHLTG